MRIVIFSLLLLATMPGNGSEQLSDSEVLKEMYEADQAVRSEERIAKGLAPTMQEERDRRFAVFELIADGKLRTANDFFRAGLILHHTGSIVYDDGHSESLGMESKLLAFFLFRRANQLGHESGLNFMAAAYNYYLNACGEESEKFGYKFEESGPVWRPNAPNDERDTLKCGFDPRPYLQSERMQ